MRRLQHRKQLEHVVDTAEPRKREDRWAGVPRLHVDPEDERPSREDKEKQKASHLPGGWAAGPFQG